MERHIRITMDAHICCLIERHIRIQGIHVASRSIEKRLGANFSSSSNIRYIPLQSPLSREETPGIKTSELHVNSI